LIENKRMKTGNPMESGDQNGHPRGEEIGSMQIDTVKLSIPEEANLIFGQSHFIKTVEDLYEILVTTVPGCRFGLAFCEASGPCLIRHVGNDEELEKAAVQNARELGCGHSFILLIKEAYPINVLRRSNPVRRCAGSSVPRPILLR